MTTLESFKLALDNLSKDMESLEARASISDDMMKNLYDLYQIIWTEALYDPYNKRSQETAQRCLPLIHALNKKLHFKK